MTEQLEKVAEFHKKFNVVDGTTPQLLNPEESSLRYRLMKEENDEYIEACEKGDLVEIADALGDQLYILFGTILKHGLQDKIEEVFSEIQRSNMSKLDACPYDTDGDGNCGHIACDQLHRKPLFREDGKIIKGPNYSKPDIKTILGKW